LSIRFRFLIALAGCSVAAAAAAACTGATPRRDPTPPPACQTNNTATVSFSNKSNSHSTYTVVWDGVALASVAPGQSSVSCTESAGVAHTLQFKFSNSNAAACNVSAPTLAQCTSQGFSCTG
jgi:hypothetical protein